MLVLHGIGVTGGVAMGTLRLVQDNSGKVTRRFVDCIQTELDRYEAATKQVAEEILEFCDKAQLCEYDTTLEIYRMMLEDDTYRDSVRNIIIRQGVCAEYAAATAGGNLAEVFYGIDDELTKARAADIKDVTEKLLSALSGEVCGVISFDRATVLMAFSLTPGVTARINKKNIAAVVTEDGYLSSHTILFAQEMNIPAIVSLSGLIDSKHDGKSAIADGETGKLYIDPDDRTTAFLLEKQMIVMACRRNGA